jgi:release factor glutamine methyltransferase
MSTGAETVSRLRRAGCVAAEEEAAELMAAAGGDPARLSDLVERRCAGEPLAWVTGWMQFGPVRVTVRPGVFVPRAQTVPMAERAAALLPAEGRGVDLFTGAGAVAALERHRRPQAAVLAVDVDPAAVDCARANGVDALLGPLDEPLPAEWAGSVDVLSAVVPYVPTEALHLLDRDSQEHEPRQALDGGPGGLVWLRAVVALAPRWLAHPHGVLLLELGGDQARVLGADLERAGLGPRGIGRDEDGEIRYLEAGRARS